MNSPALIHECSHKQSAYQVRIHFHNAYELLFVKKGTIRININGKIYDGSSGSVFDHRPISRNTSSSPVRADNDRLVCDY